MEKRERNVNVDGWSRSPQRKKTISVSSSEWESVFKYYGVFPTHHNSKSFIFPFNFELVAPKNLYAHLGITLNRKVAL